MVQYVVEVEFVVLSHASKEALWTKTSVWFLPNLKVYFKSTFEKKA